MVSLDRKIYFPASDTLFGGIIATGGGVWRVDYAGAMMVAELGVAPERGDVGLDDFETEGEPYAFKLKAVVAASERFDIQDGVLLNALCEEVALAHDQPDPDYIAERDEIYRHFDAEATQEQAGVIAKWNRFAAQSAAASGFSGWDDVAKINSVCGTWRAN